MEIKYSYPFIQGLGNIENFNNYSGIKLFIHTMKLWERVIEGTLREDIRILENQFGFMPGRLTTESIHLMKARGVL